MVAATHSPQTKRRKLYRNLMLAALASLVALSLAYRVSTFPMQWPLTLVLIACAVLAVVQFNALDEVAKQAHYIAWYWGAMSALLAILIIAVAVETGPASQIEGLLTPWLSGATKQTIFLTGLLTAPALMLVGFGGWWLAFWLRRR
jgi:hypothetical protein